jgi:hypothetical protein
MFFERTALGINTAVNVYILACLFRKSLRNFREFFPNLKNVACIFHFSLCAFLRMPKNNKRGRGIGERDRH